MAAKMPKKEVGSEVAKKDPFALHIENNDKLKIMYLDAVHEDAYYCDQSVFGDGISIEDTMSCSYGTRTALC
jgi:hypothetical protein